MVFLGELADRRHHVLTYSALLQDASALTGRPYESEGSSLYI